jgi:D-alanyl-D-alanine carboxypeptidase/D-alanyl-D-alanine carboxypeptidase (penicillin-binding protein 5/6)
MFCEKFYESELYMKRFICTVWALTVMVTSFTVKCNAAVSAKASVLIEAQTGEVILANNDGERLPMASTTKIMTTLLLIESGDLDSEFVVDDLALLTEGSSMYLKYGDTVTKRELCYGMMLPSGNDAANASALKLAGDYESFAAMMNRRAREIGMKNTNFVTPSGLHDDNHYSTAYDMALLTREALKNELFREVCSTKSITLSLESRETDKYLTNTNKLLTKYEYCIGVKTGFTDEAGRCLVSAAEKDGVTLIAVTLNDPDDWNDHINMFEYGFSVTEMLPVKEYTEKFSVKAVGGVSEDVECTLSEVPMCTAINGKSPEITEKIHLPEFVYAPVKEGDTVGYAEYYCGDELIERVDIISAQDAAYKQSEVKTPIYRKIIDWLKGFFEKGA